MINPNQQSSSANGKDTANDTISLNNIRDWKRSKTKEKRNKITLDRSVKRYPQSDNKYSFRYQISNIRSHGYDGDCFNTKGGKKKLRNICRHLELGTSYENSQCNDGTTVKYQWSFLFKKFPNEEARVTLCQFHTDESSGGSPAVQLMLIEGNKLVVKKKSWLLDDENQRILKDRTEKRTIYEVKNPQIGEIGDLELNCWYDVELTIKWSLWNDPHPDGFIACEVTQAGHSGAPMKMKRVENIYTMNSKNQYLLLGAYWQGIKPSDFEFFIDEVYVTTLD